MSRCRTPLLVIALLLAPAPALAGASEADRATARVLAQQGQDAFEAKDWATAVDRFTRADALVHAPTLMLALARAETAQGRWLLALEHLERIAREGAGPGASPLWVKAVQEARKEQAALEPRLPTAVIVLQGAGAPKAKVSIDGVAVPAAALGVNRPVDPGKRILRAEAEGFVPVEVTMTFSEGKAETVSLAIDQPAAAPPAAPPPAPPPPPAGSPLKPLGFAAVGVGGAGLIAGAVAGGMAVSQHSNLAGICPNGHCTNQQSAIDSYNLAGGVSTVGLVAGGILAATGVVLVVVAPKGSSTSAGAWIAPTVGPGFAGALGRF